MLKAVILNLDGTITDLSKFHFLSWKSVFSQYEINFGIEEWENVSNHSRNFIIKKTLELNKISYDQYLVDEIGVKKNALYKTLIQNELKPTDVNPGILELITQIKSKDLKIAVISHSKNIELIIDSLGLLKAFDYISKPIQINLDVTMPIGFSQTSEELSHLLKDLDFKGNECIGFENTNEGIEEYLQYNIFPVAITNFEENIGEKALLKYTQTSEINLDEIIFKYYTLNNE